MPAALDLIGARFNRLVVLSKSLVRDKHKKVVWKCLCDCGTLTEVNTKNLRTGNTSSCGCYWRSQITTHGKRNSVEYGVWIGMKNRCLNVKDQKTYSKYGARGINVCKQWMKFENFYADMGPRPSPQHSIERTDNNKGYTKNNCKWDTKTAQTLNRSCTRFITYKNKTLCVTHWARLIGINQDTLSYRLTKAKWPIDKAFNTRAKGYNPLWKQAL